MEIVKRCIKYNLPSTARGKTYCLLCPGDLRFLLDFCTGDQFHALWATSIHSHKIFQPCSPKPSPDPPTRDRTALLPCIELNACFCRLIEKMIASREWAWLGYVQLSEISQDRIVACLYVHATMSAGPPGRSAHSSSTAKVYAFSSFWGLRHQSFFSALYCAGPTAARESNGASNHSNNVRNGDSFVKMSDEAFA